jgi:hypothetical protein
VLLHHLGSFSRLTLTTTHAAQATVAYHSGIANADA